VRLFSYSVSAACFCATSLTAQWLNYPTKGLPRTPDGKPDLQAPTPKINGKPDLSGIWELEPGACADVKVSTCDDDYRRGPEFGDIGARIGGLPYQPWAAELVKERTAKLGTGDPVALCRPAGAVRLLTFPPYRKIIQTPDLLILLSERDVTYRQIFTDGRAVPNDPDPTWNGYSVGKWKGDTLVVETVGLREGTWLDRAGSPLMEGAKMTEKFHRVNLGDLEVEVTIDDPKTYTKPWTVKLHQILKPDTELLDYYCQDNEKDNAHIVVK